MPSTQVPEVYSVAYKVLPNPTRIYVGAPGSREEGLGNFALLTEDVVLKAIRLELRTGMCIGLN